MRNKEFELPVTQKKKEKERKEEKQMTI